MCGIAGIVKRNRTVRKEDVKILTDVLVHRGPDGEGQWVNDERTVGLGHRRLSIIDLSSNGAQPMFSADSRYSITFNGEIYNYVELKDELVAKGYTFYSATDTEVLLYLYVEEGPACLNKLDGMFAFAIWDESEKQLFCARDRFGEKPFYYHYEPGVSFVFASEIKALFACGIPRIPNEALIFGFFQLHYQLGNVNDKGESFYNGIRKLPSSSYLLLDRNLQLSVREYWNINWKDRLKYISEKDAAVKLQELFHESLKRRIRSDVPIGSSLSGGLDSSAIVCWLDKFFKEDIHSQKTFSARFKDHPKDEGKFMALVEKNTNAQATHTWPDEEKLINSIDELFYYQDEPFASTSMFAQWEVMHTAKAGGVTVLIDGQGSDEIFAGYHPYYRLYINTLYKRDKRKYGEELSAFKKMHDPAFKGHIPHDLRYFLSYGKSQVMGFLKKEHILLDKDFETKYSRINYQMPAPVSLNHNLHQSLLSGVGLEDLLRYGDRNSMACSLEVRLPFLYHKLAEFIFQLPDDFKLRNGWTKYILRKAIDGVVPNEITWRTDKIGYETPQQRWLESPKVYEMLAAASKTLQDKGILDKRITKEKMLDKGWQIIMVAKMYAN